MTKMLFLVRAFIQLLTFITQFNYSKAQRLSSVTLEVIYTYDNLGEVVRLPGSLVLPTHLGECSRDFKEI